jgi:hypothetical protein
LHAQEEYIIWVEAVVFYVKVILKSNLKKMFYSCRAVYEDVPDIKFVATN